MRVWIVCYCLLASPALRAADLTTQEIVDRVLEHNTFGFGNALARVTLVLVSKRGTERTRRIEIRTRQDGSLGKMLVRFHSPPDVAGTGLLILENEGASDDQYLYLPALGKVKRISGSQRNQRFMGTDLTYADLESRNLTKSKSIRLPDSIVGKNPTYVIESIPDDPDDSEYGKTISWIHKSSFVPLKMEFYDKRLRLKKTLLVRRLERRDGAWVVIESTIKDVQRNTETRWRVDHLDTKADVGDEQFSQRALQGG